MGKSTKKVLVCDDVEINVFMLKTLLKRNCNNIEIITAENGLVGYNKCLENEIDFVITDIEMPIMCGWDFIEKLGEINFNMKRIVVISAKLEPMIIPFARKFGILKYYLKPIMDDEIGELVNTINNLEVGIELQ